MKNTKRLPALILCLLLTASVLFGCGAPQVEYVPMTAPATEPTEPTTEPTEPPTTEPTEPPTTEPQPIVYTMSFAGDCTLGAEHRAHTRADSFT